MYNKLVANTDDSPSTEMWEQIEYDSEPTPRGGGRNCHLRPRKVKTSIYFQAIQKEKEKENACNQKHLTEAVIVIDNRKRFFGANE